MMPAIGKSSSSFLFPLFLLHFFHYYFCFPSQVPLPKNALFTRQVAFKIFEGGEIFPLR
jgi:hypothetical protein